MHSTKAEVVTAVPFKHVWQEARRGKSIGRILANHVLARWQGHLRGAVLDVACGRAPSYRRFLTPDKDVRLTVGVDYNPHHRPSVVADATRPLPFKGGTFDTVILSSFIYIPPRPQEVLCEVRRVMHDGGYLIVTAPLVFPYSPEPTDHWRFTEAGLAYVLEAARFQVEELLALGDRWCAAAYVLSPFLRPRRAVAPLVYWACMRLDTWVRQRFGHLHPCPIGYAVRAKAA